jgi:hypothetical protein
VVPLVCMMNTSVQPAPGLHVGSRPCEQALRLSAACAELVIPTVIVTTATSTASISLNFFTLRCSYPIALE